MKCVICERCPAHDGNGYCVNCAARIEAMRKRNNGQQAFRYLTYRGIVVGLFPNGGEKLVARLLARKPEGLPKGKTINLDNWCEGYTRDQIKRFKAAVLKLAAA